jgi:hypothetical protein
LQEDIFKPNHYLSLMEFRELTLQRLKRFVTADFNGRRFDVRDYMNGEQQLQGWAWLCPQEAWLADSRTS